MEENLKIGYMTVDAHGEVKWIIGLAQEDIQTGPIVDATVSTPEPEGNANP